MSAPALVLGSGVDALVAAHCLARGGRRVLLIAAAGVVDDAGWVPPQITRALELEKHGLRLTMPDPWASAPLPGGGRLELWRDVRRSAKAIRAVSTADAARWPEFCARMARLAGFLEALYLAPPPDPLGLDFALRARRLGREGLTDLMRTLPMSVADLLDDWFESEPLKGLLGSGGVRNLCMGPRSGGTAFRLLHHHVGNPPGIFRAPVSNLREVLARLAGIEIQTGAEVSSIQVQAGRASGVTLACGESIAASLVVSGLDVRRTLLELADPGWLDPELARSVGHIRTRPVSARASLQLDRPPPFTRLIVAPSLDYLERAYDDAKHGRSSAQPYVEASSDGAGRLEVDVQYVSGAADAALEALRPHLGGAQINATAWRVPSPAEAPAELTLDQAFWRRPLPELAGYRTPLAGLWLCGPSMHPGDGIAGAAGFNCAREILRSRG